MSMQIICNCKNYNFRRKNWDFPCFFLLKTYILWGVHVRTTSLYPRKLCFWVGILFSRCQCVCVCVCLSVCLLCFVSLISFKSYWLNFIKLSILIHIYRTNTYNKKVRARGQFYKSYFTFVILNGFWIFIDSVSLISWRVIFIKPCIHIHIQRTNTYCKK